MLAKYVRVLLKLILVLVIKWAFY